MDRKTQEQYEKLVLTPIKVIIPQLAIPTIISMMVSMIYNLVDAYFVGKIGTAAAAAVGILMSVQAIYQAIGFMCGHGSGSIRRFANHDSASGIGIVSEQFLRRSDAVDIHVFHFILLIPSGK